MAKESQALRVTSRQRNSSPIAQRDRPGTLKIHCDEFLAETGDSDLIAESGEDEMSQPDGSSDWEVCATSAGNKDCPAGS